MTWRPAMDAVQAAVVLASGLAPGQVVWKYQNANAPPLDYVTVAFGGLATIGQDFIQYSTNLSQPPGLEIQQAINGQRELTIELEAFTQSTADEKAAIFLLDRIRTSQLLPSVRGLMQPYGIFVFDNGDGARYVPDVVGVGFRGRAVCSMRAYTGAPLVAEYTGYIASINGTVNISGGAQLNESFPIKAP